MGKLFSLLLMLHIAGGSISLLAGTFVICSKKGNRLHKQMGKVFAYSLLVSSTIALLMAIIHPGLFLFIVGIFTLYLIGTGLRYLKYRQKKHFPQITDWLLMIGMGLFSAGFLMYGITLLFDGRLFGIVLLGFGIISSLFVRTDLSVLRNQAQKYKNFWLLLHLQRMTGAYIASLTAFLVVNNHYLPGILIWLLPTLLLTPFIVVWSLRYART